MIRAGGGAALVLNFVPAPVTDLYRSTGFTTSYY
jgi:hypothetical protein